jgi:glycosyltransferase involved in cell wall biosynthesis
MRPPHVLFLIDGLYSTYGGAEGVLWKTTRLLPPDRYRCSVATFATRTGEVVSSAFQCPVHLLPIRRMYGWNALRMAFRLSRLIQSEHIDIVHTFFHASDLLGGLVAKLSGCPVLISSRRDMGFQRTALHRLAYRLEAYLVDQVHAVGENVRLAHIRSDGLDPEKVVTIYNGVDLDQIDRAPVRFPCAEFGFENASGIIACVGNIRPVKNIEELVRTAAAVCRQEPGARFLVIGAVQDPAYFERVTELAAELGAAAQVTFAGRRQDVASLLKACDVFYLPSKSEGLSNALLEAMACRLPCVVTDVGGNPEVVRHGQNGYLVSPGDIPEAAERISSLLRNRARAAQMGREGRRIVEHEFTVEMMIAKLLESYDGLLARRAPSRAAAAGICAS